MADEKPVEEMSRAELVEAATAIKRIPNPEERQDAGLRSAVRLRREGFQSAIDVRGMDTKKWARMEREAAARKKKGKR